MSTLMNITSEHYKQGVSEIFCVQWETQTFQLKMDICAAQFMTF